MESVQETHAPGSAHQKKANPAKRTILIILFMLCVLLVVGLGAHVTGFFDELKEESVGAATTVDQKPMDEGATDTSTANAEQENKDIAATKHGADVSEITDVQVEPNETNMKNRIFNFIQNPKVKIVSAVAGVMVVVIIAVVVWQLSGLQSFDEIIAPNDPNSVVDPDIERAQELARQKEACKEQLSQKTLANGLMPLCGFILPGLVGMVLLLSNYKTQLETDKTSTLSGYIFTSLHKVIPCILFLGIGISTVIGVPVGLGDHINLFSLLSGAGLALICFAIGIIMFFTNDNPGWSKNVLIGSIILGVLGAVGTGAGLFLSVFSSLLF